MKPDATGIDLMVAYFLQIMMSLTIWLLNVAIETYIMKVTPYERQTTYTENELSIIYKLVILKFCNTWLVPLLSNLSNKEWFKNHGLVEEVTMMIIFMNVGETFRVIFNYGYFIKMIQRWLLRRRGTSSLSTQLQANNIFENDEIELSITMSVILVFTFSILWFAPIIPGLSIFGIVLSICIYWVYKYLILRRMSIKKSFSAKLLTDWSNVIKYAIFMNAIMGFYFYVFIHKDMNSISIIVLVWAFLFIIVPVRPIIISSFVRKVEREDNDYFDNYIKKFKHYDVQNPVTKAIGQSRIDGHSLRDAIIRCIIKVIEKRVSKKDNDFKLNNLRGDHFGVNGLNALLAADDDLPLRRSRKTNLQDLINKQSTGDKNLHSEENLNESEDHKWA